VLWEADRRDEQTARSLEQQSRRKRPTLTPDEATTHLRLAVHLSTHDGWPPSITRSYKARTRHLNALYAAHGPLVLLRYHLDELNEWPLRGDDLPAEARPLIKECAARLLLPGTPYTVDIQRGGLGRTHCHPVAPLSGLRPEHAALVTAARHGPQGGCELLDGQAYGVLLLPDPKNRSNVARYVTRHPDGRLDHPGTPDHLDALEDELSYTAARALIHKPRRAKRMGWEVGVRPLL
jgi:hypothetical protein